MKNTTDVEGQDSGISLTLNISSTNEKSFDDTHLAAAKRLKASGLYPDRYKKPFGKFLKTDIIDNLQIVRPREGTQGKFKSRYAGRNEQAPALESSILEHGFQLKYLPIAVRLMPDGTYELLDGRTRDEICASHYVTNRIVDIYDCTEEEADKFGISANLKQPIYGAAKKIDIIAYLQRSILRGELVPLYDDWSIDDIQKLVHTIDEVAGDGSLTRKTRFEIASAVLNHEMTDCEVRSWTTPQVRDWLIKNKYVQTKEVIYEVLSSNQPTRALGQAATKYCTILDNNDDVEVRVVVHTGLLDGFDLEACYENRINSFRLAWESQLNAVSHAFFGSKTPLRNRVKLWGSIPAIYPNHDENRILRFRKPPVIADEEIVEYDEAA